jgi:hypothetical protein
MRRRAACRFLFRSSSSRIELPCSGPNSNLEIPLPKPEIENLDIHPHGLDLLEPTILHLTRVSSMEVAKMISRAIAASFLITCFWIGWTTPVRGQELGKLVSDGQSVSGHAHPNGNAGIAVAAVNVPMWPGFFFFNGVRYNFTMVGSDPTVVGTGTTNVPVVIIPLSFSYPNGTVVSPIATACGDNTSVLTRIQGSPLFTTNVTWVEGNTIVGVTQFTDAFQRANFWPSSGVLLSDRKKQHPGRRRGDQERSRAVAVIGKAEVLLINAEERGSGKRSCLIRVPSR